MIVEGRAQRFVAASLIMLVSLLAFAGAAIAGNMCAQLRGTTTEGGAEFAGRRTLSPFMNSIPPSKDYFCVGTGASNMVLHPDRAPHTQLAAQGPVVLFSGAAPQQGLNFTLTAGSLVYRNQM